MLRVRAWAVGAVAAVLGEAAFGQTTVRVSVATGGAQGNAYSTDSSISADGRFVAFSSLASNLVAGDTNGQADVFVRDCLNGTTERVSVATGGAQANLGSDLPAISADGRYVALRSVASNLVPGDTNGAWDVFVRDRQSGTTERASVATGGTQGNSHSDYPSISASGRHVAFRSDASNLIAGDTAGQSDIFVRDRLNGTTERVSVATGGAQGGGHSFQGSISADGRYVAFSSNAANLVAGDTNTWQDVFVRDRQSGTTERVSVATGGAQATGSSSYWPSVSADGRFVAFVTSAANLVSGDTNGWQDIFVRDRQSGTTERASVATGEIQGNSWSEFCSISADGRCVAFRSNASNLVAGDTNGLIDVFVRDRQNGATELVSVASSGAQGNFDSEVTTVSADGRYVAFMSHASSLVAGDTNSWADVFVHDRLASPPAPVNHVFLGSPSIPMQGVQVIAEQGGTLVSTATTGADGSYSFTNPVPPLGIYRVCARITYTIPGTATAKSIYAYPADDPYTSWCLGCSPTGGGSAPSELPAIVFPWPVVLQGGWDAAIPVLSQLGLGGEGGGLATWSDPAQPHNAIGFLTEDPGDPSSPHYQRKKDERIPAFLCFPMPKISEDASGYDPTYLSDYDENAGKLSAWIESKVKPVLAQRVASQDMGEVAYSFLCHSMGAPIVRALVTRSVHPPVNKIVSMDGIHGGGYVMQPVPFLPQSASLGHLSERYMNGSQSAPDPCSPAQPGWNRPANTDLSHPERWLLFSANGPSGAGDFVGPDLSPWGHGRVRLSSYLAQLTTPYCILDWVDGRHRWANDTHQSIHDNIDRLCESARWLLGKSEGLEDQEPLILATPEPVVSQGYVTGSLTAATGTTTSLVVPFDSNRKVRGGFLRGGAGSSFLLRGPNGSILTLEGLQSETVVPGTFVDKFDLTMPPSGSITIELTAGSAPAGLDFSLHFENGNRLWVEVGPPAVMPGAPVLILASMRDFDGTLLNGPNASFDASVAIPQSLPMLVTLFDDGGHGDGGAADGVFGNSFAGSPIPGQYYVTGQGRITVGADVVVRSASCRFDVTPAGIAFVGSPTVSTPDADGDGFYDSLVLAQTVSLASARSISLAARLLDGLGDEVYAVTSELLHPASGGNFSLSLMVPGTEIVRHGIDGPWTLVDLTAFDLDADGLPAATASSFVTPPLLVSSFAPPAGPQVSHCVPASGLRSGGTAVVLHGSGLLDATSVSFGSNPASFVVTGDGTIEVTTPPAGTPGGPGIHPLGSVPVDVTVTTPWGTIIAVHGFTYLSLLPR